MIVSLRFFALIVLLICCGKGLAQKKEAGPIIKDYGKVWPLQNPEYAVETELVFKAVFDVMNSPDSHEDVNPSIETVARYLNMHAQNGVPKENLEAVLVIHNKASKDIMKDSAYKKRYGVVNPNRQLIDQLNEAGVEVIFCGQSSLSRDIPQEDIISEVKLSLSAMTALIQLQNKGYKLIKF